MGTGRGGDGNGDGAGDPCLSLLVESLHMQIDSERVYQSTEVYQSTGVGFRLHT